ncbi:MAG: HAMP domain-containing histidine kinase [Gammaproteobacteria bacterium]|nr:HAMP domain-containing histidine kinase [Gammaproteobacteria bacterium]
MAVVLVLLFASVGLLYALISTSATVHYMDELNQKLNRDLARNLVADRNLVAEGRIDQLALKETFAQYMVINPSIEIYLLDLSGKILAYSADPGKVKRNRVSLEPINEFIRQGGKMPLLGDDPRSHDRQKAFSVTQVPSTEHPEGYLYVVLRGEQYEAADKLARESFFLRLSGWSVAASLGFGLIAGLLIFRLLTRRLHRLSMLMDRFHQSDFSALPVYAESSRMLGDEVDRIGVNFEQMAVRIQDQLGQLKTQDSLRRRLVAQVSHDLRTPLTSLQGYLESLSIKGDSLTSEERDEYLGIALRQSRRLSQQLNELFELASLDARETEPHSEPFPLAELIQDVVQKYRLRAESQNIKMQMPSSGALPFVHADIGLTERVLENLIENAFTHTPEKGVISVLAEPVGDFISVSVRDNGKGIEAQDLQHIFEPFFQSGNSGQSRQHAGLGLAIARRITEMQGGRIFARSEPGEGATITFTLPLKKPVPVSG